MPTAAKLIAGLMLAALGWWLAQYKVPPLLEEGVNIGNMPLVVLVVGLIVGWRIVGANSGDGYLIALTQGITGPALLFLLSVTTISGWQALEFSLRRRYHGPVDAFEGTIDLAVANTAVAGVPSVLIPLFVGGLLIALLAEAATRLSR